METVSKGIDELISNLRELKRLEPEIARAGSCLAETLRSGGTVYTFGNGGGAATALHLAEELLGKYRLVRRPLASMCLSADAASLTCIGNDFGFGEVFARQVEALVKEGDAVVAFSSSGSSENVVKGLEAAERKGAATVLLTGSGAPEAGGASVCVAAPSGNTSRIQEMHTLILHLFLESVEAALFGKGSQV